MRTFLVNISKRMENVSTKQRLLFVVMVMIIGPMINGDMIGIAKLREMTGGIGMLDMELFYSPAQAYTNIDSLGPDGREFYVWLLVLDFAVILAFGLMQSAFTTLLLQKLSVPEKWLRLNLLPFARGMCDVLENCCLLFIVCHYPTTFEGIARIANIMTMLKWLTMAASMGVILLALIGLGWKTVMRRVRVTRTLEIESMCKPFK